MRDRKAAAELHALSRFNELFMATMKARQQQIAEDKKLLKFNELRGQVRVFVSNQPITSAVNVIVMSLNGCYTLSLSADAN